MQTNDNHTTISMQHTKGLLLKRKISIQMHHVGPIKQKRESVTVDAALLQRWYFTISLCKHLSFFPHSCPATCQNKGRNEMETKMCLLAHRSRKFIFLNGGFSLFFFYSDEKRIFFCDNTRMEIRGDVIFELCATLKNIQEV